MARHVASVGFGTPDVVYTLYATKIALYIAGAMGFALTTPGIDGFFSLTNWWAAPVVFVKLYLALPWLWWVKGRQFLVVARKPLV